MKIRFRCEIPVYKKLSFTDSGYSYPVCCVVPSTQKQAELGTAVHTEEEKKGQYRNVGTGEEIY